MISPLFSPWCMDPKECKNQSPWRPLSQGLSNPQRPTAALPHGFLITALSADKYFWNMWEQRPCTDSVRAEQRIFRFLCHMTHQHRFQSNPLVSLSKWVQHPQCGFKSVGEKKLPLSEGLKCAISPRFLYFPGLGVWGLRGSREACSTG